MFIICVFNLIQALPSLCETKNNMCTDILRTINLCYPQVFMIHDLLYVSTYFTHRGLKERSQTEGCLCSLGMFVHSTIARSF